MTALGLFGVGLWNLLQQPRTFEGPEDRPAQAVEVVFQDPAMPMPAFKGERRDFPEAGVSVFVPEGFFAGTRQRLEFTYLQIGRLNRTLNVRSSPIMPWMPRQALLGVFKNVIWSRARQVKIPNTRVDFEFNGETWAFTQDSRRMTLILVTQDRLVTLTWSPKLARDAILMQGVVNSIQPQPSSIREQTCEALRLGEDAAAAAPSAELVESVQEDADVLCGVKLGATASTGLLAFDAGRLNTVQSHMLRRVLAKVIETRARAPFPIVAQESEEAASE